MIHGLGMGGWGTFAEEAGPLMRAVWRGKAVNVVTVTLKCLWMYNKYNSA